MNLLAIVLLVLLPLAAAQTSYPGCIAPSCTPLRNAALSTCGFDIAATLNATLVQTQCICNMNNLQSVMQSCLECLQLSPDASVAADFAEICTGASESTSTGTSTSTSRSTVTSSSTTRTTTTSTDTHSSTTEHSSTSTGSSTATTSTTSTTSQKQLAGIPTIAPAGAGAGRVAHVPVFGLAVVLAVVAQAAF